MASPLLNTLVSPGWRSGNKLSSGWALKTRVLSGLVSNKFSDKEEVSLTLVSSMMVSSESSSSESLLSTSTFYKDFRINTRWAKGSDLDFSLYCLPPSGPPSLTGSLWFVSHLHIWNFNSVNKIKNQQTDTNWCLFNGGAQNIGSLYGREIRFWYCELAVANLVWEFVRPYLILCLPYVYTVSPTFWYCELAGKLTEENKNVTNLVSKELLRKYLVAYYMCSVTKEQCKFEVSHLRAKAVELGLVLGGRANNFKLAEIWSNLVGPSKDLGRFFFHNLVCNQNTHRANIKRQHRVTKLKLLRTNRVGGWE